MIKISCWKFENEMSLFNTTYNCTINNSHFERLKIKSNNNLSKIFIPVSIGRAGDQKFETSIVSRKTNENEIGKC